MADVDDAETAFRCPYCHTEEVMPEPVRCQGCGAVYHLDCWTENGGCAVPGCSHAPRPWEQAPTSPAVQAAGFPAPAAGFAVPTAGFAVPTAEPQVAVFHSFPATGSPAGWYFDPMSSAHLRYWNGFQWTTSLAPR